ncbi:PTS sugar transporter subunit IIA [Brevibacillus humidisoli]|uniref:PTS sugar transporter subunit IIA n=1 Tax=Brevibacillus humidisoli TaxID=2895522 RepID=UPI001E56A68F|nr:PTS sugar transporter subunit IIA [Brevibacillus humidisoli]UFJ41772.1 PTS sugar transporter subunit IIA [Brevibacillus humidisoli]
MLPLCQDVVLLDAEANSAEEAIRLAGDLLVKAGKVAPEYVEAMVKGYQDIGPYIVLAPGIAIPHARPEHGVKEQCVSLIRLNQPVAFGHPTNDPVRLVCAIGGVDDTGHIGMLQELAGVLGDSGKLEGILAAASYEELQQVMQ